MRIVQWSFKEEQPANTPLRDFPGIVNKGTFSSERQYAKRYSMDDSASAEMPLVSIEGTSVKDQQPLNKLSRLVALRVFRSGIVSKEWHP